tara:strand:- start:4965 stop:6566 length:1602 start_codon:yes stop_codon:yes gene_type:complete
MIYNSLSFRNTGYFSSIINDYLIQDEKIKPFYKDYPTIENFKQIIENKEKFPFDRAVLVDDLKAQYAAVKIKKAPQVFQNIELLADGKTFTITTGHQLCLYTGPLYFIYKIISVINLCKQLKAAYPEYSFVPVYWMATEDHDFEEVNHFNFKGKKLVWDTDQKGGVGRFKLKGLERVYEEFSSLLTDYNENTTFIRQLFEKAYLKQDNLADATRVLVHDLFQTEGLVIIDGDRRELKKAMIPAFKDELIHATSSSLIEKTNAELSTHYKIQVNPREINLFYLDEGIRARIVADGDDFVVNETDLRFTEDELLSLLETAPEKFSPNVVLRPLYQETILPNLAYIGGGGELAYWFQLKSVFEHFAVPFPGLLLRNSAAILDNKQTKLYHQLNIDLEQLFTPEVDLIKELVKESSSIDFELSVEKQELTTTYEKLKQRAALIDVTLIPHFEARLTKHIIDLEVSGKKLLRAEKKKNKELVDKITTLKASLFPKGGLQERTDNFSSIYYNYGSAFMTPLYENFSLPTDQFSVVMDKG